jgi:hypothetical protein
MYNTGQKARRCLIGDNSGRKRAGGYGVYAAAGVGIFRVGWLEGGSEGANWRTPPLPGEESASPLGSLRWLFAQSGRRSVASVGHRSPANLSPSFPVERQGVNTPRPCFTTWLRKRQAIRATSPLLPSLWPKAFKTRADKSSFPLPSGRTRITASATDCGPGEPLRALVAGGSLKR